MKMNIGVWIGIIAGIFGFAVAIASVWVTAGSEGPIIVGGMLLVFGGMFFLFYKLFFGPMFNNRRLQKTGIPGKARIIEVRDTNITINNSPQVKLVVEAKNSFGQKYTATIRTLVSRINPFVYQPGMEIPVKTDPKNEQNMVIDESGGSGTTSNSYAAASNLSAQLNEAALKAELEKMQAETEPVRVAGKPARAIVKKYNWLGAYVNGNNPFVELELEVLPENTASFSAKTKGVIAEVSVHKFQPGCEIYVKYDYYDNSKVAIDHS